MIGKVAQDFMTAASVVNVASSAASVGKESGNNSGSAQQQAVTNGREKPQSANDGVAKARAEAGVKAAMEKQVAKEEDKLKAEKAKKEPINEQQISLAMQEINRLMSRMNCNLQFEYNKDVDFMSVKMIDKKTHEVIKEVPPEEMIEHMKNNKDWIGAFIDQNA